nr:unnamed protein product [Digitaria exilis]
MVMNVAISAALCCQLGPNIRALRMELLYAQGMLENSQGREIRGPALSQLLQELWQLAYNAEDVLDELDYFRIQDELDSTCETATADPRGLVGGGAALNARHTMKAIARLLGLRKGSPGGNGVEEQGDVRQLGALSCARPRPGQKSASCARRTARATERSSEKGGLHGLRSLQVLVIWSCPKFFSGYKTSFSSSYCPFPSSLEALTLIDVEGFGTLKPLSNLTSLAELCLEECGDDLRGEGLLPLITQGQLSRLKIQRCPYFFVGSDLTMGLQNDDYRHLLHSPSKLQMLQTDDVAGVLVDPICRLLSFSLRMLKLQETHEVLCFTEEQEDALQLLTSLEVLQFSCCFELQYLPSGLHTLTNLKSLHIWACPAINSLPKDGLPISLKELVVHDCHNKELQQQCEDLIPCHPEIKIC